ncbi:hypothetical protein PtB15_11B343 [Puccinia triticina]|nr:hypothetical protein PtB15_11B343 [Puccinia triticina]
MTLRNNIAHLQALQVHFTSKLLNYTVHLKPRQLFVISAHAATVSESTGRLIANGVFVSPEMWQQMQKNLSVFPNPSPSAPVPEEVSSKRISKPADVIPELANSCPGQWPAELIATKRGSLPVHQDSHANLHARKSRKLLAEARQTHQPVLTMGAVQQCQMAHHLPIVHVSGWAASSTFVPGTHEVRPGLADYPYHTVPTAVQRHVKAQQLHDRKEWAAHPSEPDIRPSVDYLKPIVADGDNGHGGLSTVMKLAKAFGEAGVAGVHFEDQLVGGKKCGHQAGKVLVPTCEHLSRLRAARMQWFIMGLETLVIGRTDAESAKLIDAAPTMTPATIASSWASKPPRLISKRLPWPRESSGLRSAAPRVMKSMRSRSGEPQVEAEELSHREASILARKMIQDGTNGKETPEQIGWNAQLARTREGYYRAPNPLKAQSIATQIHRQFPAQSLVYNLWPSFTWSHHGYSPEDLTASVRELSRFGSNLQLISLAGLHSTATMTAQLAKRVKEDGMLGYVESIQAVEKDIGCDVLKHQKWSGSEINSESEYIDRILSAVSAGSSAKKTF